MKETVPTDLRQIGLGAFSRQVLAIYASGLYLLNVVDLDSRYVFHGDHLLCGQVHVYVGHFYVLSTLEVLLKALGILRLELVIDLLVQQARTFFIYTDPISRSAVTLRVIKS